MISRINFNTKDKDRSALNIKGKKKCNLKSLYMNYLSNSWILNNGVKHYNL